MTIIGIIQTLLAKTQNAITTEKHKILICAPSNLAVDEILLRLKKGIMDYNGEKKFVKFMLRIGNITDEKVEDYDLNVQ